NFASALSPTLYGALVSAGIKYWQENRSWSELERLADNCLLSYLRRAKYVVFGLEPLIAYLLARENEIKMLRIIMVGKLNGLPTDLLRSRLRDTYQ
ncbi:V-type ATPase subunit, partial [candidate division NPL-UPA2 bacterium]|nr:V-type ATPase subunit [candidate division NPL-UPA2 bacterium]